MPVNRNDIEWQATVKAYPAISDLQAIEAQIDYLHDAIAGAIGAHNFDTAAVPAGKLWVLTFATMWDDGGILSLAQIMLKGTADQHKLIINPSPASQTQTSFNGYIVMKPTEYVRFAFSGVPLAADTLVCTMRAYQVSQY